VLFKQFKSTWHQWEEDVLLRRINALDAIRKGPTGLGNGKPTAVTIIGCMGCVWRASFQPQGVSQFSWQGK
jgi:hypothetical protein